MNPPNHIAIIPDGNRRWARQNNKMEFEGHKRAFEEVLPDLIRKADQLGVKYFTFWSLSTENLVKRSKQEIEALFSLAKHFYKKGLRDFNEEGVRMQFIGDLAGLPDDIQKIIATSIEETKNNKKITLVIAINYGGRDELMRALKKVITMNYLATSVNATNFDQFLDTKGIPEPELIIRTGGEKRLSGLMPWQSVYSELYFSDLMFPDFSPAELEKAVEDFYNRKRNFGK
ncbi:MAG: polyprenyl diphosphate synthase [Patescibacteria group bacterium]